MSADDNLDSTFWLSRNIGAAAPLVTLAGVGQRTAPFREISM